MNFWTFLDRNAHGFFLFGVIVLCFSFGTCGSSRGCVLRPQEPAAADGGAK